MNFISIILLMRFVKIMLQEAVLLFNMNIFIPINFDGSYVRYC
jgi:hypothetical protein